MSGDALEVEAVTRRVIELVGSILRGLDEYRENQITEDIIRRNVPIAKTVAIANGIDKGLVDRVNDDMVWMRVKRSFSVHQPEAARLDGREGDHEPWFRDKRTDLIRAHGFWDNYRRLLETGSRNTKPLPAGPLRRLDEATDEILGLLEDPSRPGQWDRRGLVMGHVQSGKTSNYCGLIAKAADAGYKLIVVMAGTHNNLRAQTQMRVDDAMVGRDSSLGLGQGRSDRRVGVGLETQRKEVLPLTSAMEAGDFKVSTAEMFGFSFGAIEHPTIFVIKKNVRVLENLYNWVRANAHIPDGYERVADIPLLLIDDEADSASINTADTIKDPDTDPTRTNQWIRRLLNTFDQTGFVGYTATPFANIFIDRQADHPKYGEDLFPRSFIFSLEAPSNWVGPEKIFGITPVDDEDDYKPLPVVTEVEDSEDWVPPRHRADLVVEADNFPDSLDTAIRAFVLSCAARRARGDAAKDMSMLVHVTPFVKPQEQVCSQIQDRLWRLSQRIQFNKDVIYPELEQLWNDKFVPAAEVLQADEEPPPIHEFDDIEPELAAAVTSIEVRMINGKSDDVLDYGAEREKGLALIVIGGAKLSRGLTLEGLSVSYYLRSTRMYDTLMQMGRWFGYRGGYLDLCRIYTTPEIIGWYQNITIATRELLDDFRQMEAEGATPAEFGLKVRHSPGMLVTSQAKMRGGVRRRVAFGQTRPETTSLDVDRDVRTTCLRHFDEFIGALREAVGPGRAGRTEDVIWSEVPAELVIGYFEALGRDGLYETAIKSLPRYIAEYIGRRNTEGGVTEWTVLLKSNSDAAEGNRRDCGQHSIGLSTRRQSGSTNLATYSPKSVVGSVDESVDLDPELLEKLRAESAETGSKAHGTQYRALRDPSRGLLILYLLTGKKADILFGDHIPDGDPFVAYCLSFPRDPSGTTVEYVVDGLYDQQESFDIDARS